ncbi:MAG: DUF2723 domain-containing protein [Chitinophagaceae bacterium]|nr:DUF2723 domain-containing protein [Chitinophagaceae bacterium]
MNYRKVNNIVGWITGIIAIVVYLVTMEPTVSFWDCGEFISCAYKIEVGHSPGAPLFMMIQRMFGILAGSNLSNVAMFINAWSAIASGLTILFLFWTITHFARRLLVGRTDEPNSNHTLLIMGAGLVGALAYTFSDTFWFSAVEAEVYATSSLFTAVVFWAILKWEHIADQPHADRWLLFIAYMMGLSVGIHLLNLLAIPAITMVYYFRRYETNRRGTIIAFLIGCALLGLVQFGILQGVPMMASQFDLLFVNSFGMPFDSGALVFVLLFIAFIIWLLLYVKRRGWYLAHTGVLCIIFILIGFSSYLAPMIRSRADVAIDMTNPDNINSTVSYIKREQFGSNPLLFGPDFDKRPIKYNVTGDRYIMSQKDGKDFYEDVGDKIEAEFSAGDKRFFPRIWDYNDANHKNFYRNYLGLGANEAPTASDNFSFFFRYQINWMWWRYFMWNYAGRQNDFEGQGDPKNGNWISGIPFIDKGFLGLGDMSAMADGYKDNPARNQFYLLPFIIGLLGLVYQWNNNKKDWITILVLFFFTGIATAIYLNMPPLQPRERDYAFAGSTYAYAIWIGIGVLMVHQFLQRVTKGPAAGVIATVICLIAAPVIMAKDGWDDHDRSKKTLAKATASNVLNSCAPNAIIFTFGDNDTYPLWYMQEVEGLRKDVRVINMSLLGIDWYIEQLNNRINDAMPVPMIWKKEHYIGDRRNYMRYVQSPQIASDRFFNLSEICEFMLSDNPNYQVQMSDGSRENFIPSKNFFLPSFTKEELLAKGLAAPEDTARIITDIRFQAPKDILYKDDLATYNIIAAIAAEGWERPIYFSGGLPGDNYVGLDDYMKLEGVVYRLMPYKQIPFEPPIAGEMGSINTTKSYDLFMNQYLWGNADRDDVYFDEKNRIMFAAYRINSSRIAMEMAANGQTEKGKEVLDKVRKSITKNSYHYDATAYYMALGYFRIGDKESGREMALQVVQNSIDDINYISTLKDGGREQMIGDVQRDLNIMRTLSQAARQYGDAKTADELDAKIKMMETKATSF